MKDLVKALEDKKIYGAGLDVFEGENYLIEEKSIIWDN